MKKIVSIIILFAATETFAQTKSIPENTVNTGASTTIGPIGEIILPMLFIAFLIFMLTRLVKYFLEFRIKNKLIERGMSEQLSAYLLDNNEHEKRNDAVKWAILLCGIGVGLTATYLTAPIDIHSLAIMAFSLGLSYWVYFLYLKK